MNPLPSPLFSVTDAMRFGWSKTRENLRAFLGLGALGLFLTLLQQSLSATPAGAGSLRRLLSLVIQGLQVCVTLAYIRLALRVHDGERVDLSRPFTLLEDFFSFLLTTVMYGLIVAGGTALLIVPGIVWALTFVYSAFLVADQHLDPLAALRESARLTRGTRWRLLGFMLVSCAANMLGMLALGIGLLVTAPTTLIAAAYVLRQLQAHAGPSLTVAGGHQVPQYQPSMP